jgi:hypothetical protein
LLTVRHLQHADSSDTAVIQIGWHSLANILQEDTSCVTTVYRKIPPANLFMMICDDRVLASKNLDDQIITNFTGQNS